MLQKLVIMYILDVILLFLGDLTIRDGFKIGLHSLLLTSSPEKITIVDIFK